MWKNPVMLSLYIAAILGLSLWLSPQSLTFRALGPGEIGSLLAVFFIVAAVVERALEVFLTAWRGPQAAEFELEVRAALREVSSLRGPGVRAGKDASRESGGLAGALTSLKSAELGRTRHKSQTQRIALPLGLLLGLLVGAVGFRVLESLLAPTAFDRLSVEQAGAFHALDVLLSGGLIAGGSEGIHKLAQVYTTFLEVTNRKAKGEDK